MKSWRIQHTILLVLIAVFTLLTRTIGLGSYPDGLHLDEIWTATNALELANNGTNIYGKPCALTMDMFGDHVSAFSAYFTIPGLWFFGGSAWAIRLPTVIAGLTATIMILWWLWQKTKSPNLLVIASAAAAVSPLATIMTRASSQVSYDMIMLAGFIISFDLAINQKDIKKQLLGLGWSYLWASVAYATYFTSRLLIIPIGIILLLAQWRSLPFFGLRKWLNTLPLIIFLIFPFLWFLNTPYAQGRFSQTSVLSNPTVEWEITNRITWSGVSGWPPIVTRVFSNRPIIVLRQWAANGIALFNPKYLFELEKPPRYRMPSLGPVSLLDYLGIFLAMGILLLPVGEKSLRRLLFIMLSITLISLVPTSLTVDDSPNWQRALISAPYWSITASLAIYLIWQAWSKKERNGEAMGALAISAITLVVAGITGFGLFFNYRIHARLFDPYFRDKAQLELAKWLIESNIDPNTSILATQGNFFLTPFFLEQKSINDWSVEKSNNYFFTSDHFSIGKWYFSNNICNSEAIVEKSYDLLILDATPKGCPLPWWFEEQFIAKFADDQAGFVVGKPRPDQFATLQESWQSIAQTASASAYLQNIIWNPKPLNN